MPIGLMPIRVSGHLLISYGLAIALGNGHTAHTLVSCPYIAAFLEYQECPHSTKGYNEVPKGNIVISDAWQCAVVRRHCDLLGSTNNDWTKAVLPSLSLSLSHTTTWHLSNGYTPRVPRRHYPLRGCLSEHVRGLSKHVVILTNTI